MLAVHEVEVPIGPAVHHEEAQLLEEIGWGD